MRTAAPSAPTLGCCTAAETRAIRRLATEVIVPPGGIIHPEGCSLNWVYLVVDGEAIAHGRRGHHVVSAGEAHGAVAALNDEPDFAALTARTEVRLLILGRAEFAALIRANAGLAHTIARQLAAHTPHPIRSHH